MSILLFLAVLVVLILVHELGHFLVAKWSRIRVDEFGIFFPPKLCGKKVGETEYTLNLWPIGGFVRIFGENYESIEASDHDAPRAFFNKPWYIQAAVLVAGVFFNVLAAWVLFSVSFMIGIPTSVSGEAELKGAISNPELTIVSILPDSPAFEAGLRVGDVITSIASSYDTLTTLSPEAAISFIETHSDGALILSVTRGETEEMVSLHPRTDVIAEEPERAVLGISLDMIGVQTVNSPWALWEGLKLTVVMLSAVAAAIGSFFASAFTLSADLSQVAGPVGIVSLVGDAAELGIVPLLTFTALISLNLAIINLLPIPALDGGRLVFVLVEALKGSPIKPRIAQILNAVGFALLIFLMVAVTYNDILRLIS
jgi:regulator of sigma E protease